MATVSFAVNCNSPIYKRLDELYNRIAAIEPHKRPHVWLHQVFDIRRAILDNSIVVELVASEIVTITPYKLVELEETLKLWWDPYHQCYVPYWKLWFSGTLLAGLLALLLHMICSLLGSLSVYL